MTNRARWSATGKTDWDMGGGERRNGKNRSSRFSHHRNGDDSIFVRKESNVL